MIHKVINTMFHGSLKARLFFWFLFFLILVSLFLSVFALVMRSSSIGKGAAACIVCVLILSQSVSMKELSRKANSGGKQSRRTVQGNAIIEEKADKVSRQEKARRKARFLVSVNEKKMKGILKDHKVRQKHIFFLIDSYPEKKLEQTPAVMWKTDTHVHILALEGSAVEIAIPRLDVCGILYMKNVPADPRLEYPSFRYSNFISRLYSPYLPEYHEINQEGELHYTKNLFQIQPGIAVTNTSLRKVMEVLTNVPFVVDDAVNASPLFDEYFKEAYRYSILCKNMVITLEEYREKLEVILEKLLIAPVTGQEFIKSLRDMNRYHLVTSDYVTKYTQRYQQKRQ